jgi:aldose 1-epimerase
VEIRKQRFGITGGGQEVDLFTLGNDQGIVVKITNYGGIITSLSVPDRNGNPGDIVLGFDNLEEYLGEHPYFGAIIGRICNRLSKAKFVLDGKSFLVSANRETFQLHGGFEGFDKKVWEAKPIEEVDYVSLELKYLSPDGEEGHPGNLNVTVDYRLSNTNEFRIFISAATDKPTPINLTNHSYYNLAGEGSGTVYGHELMINADYFTRLDHDYFPTGEIAAVSGTDLDFIVPRTIGERIHNLNKGYDHNYVLRKPTGALDLIATVREPVFGRQMEIFSTEPGMQLCTANWFDGKLAGKGGKFYEKHSAFCMETQHFPDSPNHPEFPSVFLRPGEIFNSETILKFSTFSNDK